MISQWSCRSSCRPGSVGAQHVVIRKGHRVPKGQIHVGLRRKVHHGVNFLAVSNWPRQIMTDPYIMESCRALHLGAHGSTALLNAICGHNPCVLLLDHVVQKVRAFDVTLHELEVWLPWLRIDTCSKKNMGENLTLRICHRGSHMKIEWSTYLHSIWSATWLPRHRIKVLRVGAVVQTVQNHNPWTVAKNRKHQHGHLAKGKYIAGWLWQAKWD